MAVHSLFTDLTWWDDYQTRISNMCFVYFFRATVQVLHFLNHLDMVQASRIPTV